MIPLRLVGSFLIATGAFAACARLVQAHEGHQPLPTKGVQVDVRKGHVALARPAREVLDIQTVEIQTGTIVAGVPAYATVVTPWTRQANVTSRLAGRVVRLHVQPGETVREGQPLADLESLDLQTLRMDYQKTQNDLDLARTVLDSLGPAVKSGSIPGQRLVDAETTRRQAENTLEIVRAKAAGLHVPEVDLATQAMSSVPVSIPSPLDGVIVHSDLAVGRYVEPTDHLFEIVDSRRVWVEIAILERDLHRVHEGQTVRLQFPALPQGTIETKLTRIGRGLDPQSHQVTVWADVENAADDPPLRAGMTGTAELVLSSRAESLSVPLSAVFSDGAERYVFVEETATRESSEYRKRPVVLGRQSGTAAEVLAGEVYPGDRVVIRGGHELSSLFFLGVLRLGETTAKAIGLKLEAVTDRPIEEVLRLDGAVEVPPQHRTEVSAQLTGVLQAIHVDRAQAVRPGDPLADIASLELQDVQLDLVQAHLGRQVWQDLLNRRKEAGDVVPPRTLAETERQLVAAETQVANLRQKLLTIGMSADEIEDVLQTKRVREAITLRAPLPGRIVRFTGVLGQVIRANQPILEIHDLDQLRIQAYVPERDSARITVGQRARLRFTADPGMEVKGTVTRLGPIVASDSRTQAVWIDFDGPPPEILLHNMLVRVSVAVGEPAAVLGIPLSAVVRDGLHTFAFVRKTDGTFERRRIELGRSDDRFVQVLGGVARGESIATGGVAQLQTAYASLR